MSLIDLNRKEKNTTLPAEAFSIASNAAAAFFNAGSLKQFKQSLFNLEQNKHYHFATGGQWSMHELIIFLLKFTGPAHIYKCTWAIAEDPVRALINMQEKKQILSIHAILDYKVKDQKSQAYHLARENFTSVTLAKCHAKVTVIKNDEWCISVFGSQNDTRNPRPERGCVCTVKEIAEADIVWLQALMENKNPFKVK